MDATIQEAEQAISRTSLLLKETGNTQNHLSSVFHRFTSAFLALSTEEREELFTATFEVTPACIPYVTIHLFGEENFKRGEFMAALKARYQQTGFGSADELPDHLSVILRFAAQTEPSERRELLEFCILGPLSKMIAALDENHPFRALLESIQTLLQDAYPDLRPALSPMEQMQRHGLTCAPRSACECGVAPPSMPRAVRETKENQSSTVIHQPAV